MRRLSFLFFMFFCLACGSARAEFKTASFAQIPVQHEGRIKPLQSFAQSSLKRLSGDDGKGVIWLMDVLFNPARAEQTPMIKIKNPDLLSMLELEKRKDGLFSYAEISQALGTRQDIILSLINTPQDQWTTAQKDLIALQEKTVFLGDLLSSLTMFLPIAVVLPESVPNALKPYAGQPLIYMDTLKFRESLQKQVELIVKLKGQDIDQYNEAEQAMSILSFSIARLQQSGLRSKNLRVIPGNENLWHSPWEVITEGAGGPEQTKLFTQWQNLAAAYHRQDFETWKEVSTTLLTDMSRYQNVRSTALKAEYIYNTIRFFFVSFVLYLVGISFLGLQKNRAAVVALGTGALFHISGIILRIYILQRPPVSTLYESILFAGVIIVVYGLLAYGRDHKTLWLYVAAIAGALLHLLGFAHDQDSNSMLMLTAVLNTNFWLATHVICITAGYGFCLLTSMLAHFMLFKAARTKTGKPDQTLFKQLHTLALIALLLTSTGTVLGGIWADQSWGRFWGWDPKENGALLIVLWLIWIIHGRISGQMKQPFVIAGLAYLSVIVTLSWFGVNMLSVGLHAYGFTDFAAWLLGGFIGLETLAVTSLFLTIKKKEHT